LVKSCLPPPLDDAEEHTGARPLFLLGLERGGTTYVQRLLNAHGQIVLWGENGGLVTYLRRSCERARNIRAVDETVYRGSDALSTAWTAWCARFENEALVTASRDLLERLYRSDDVAFWGFKEIRHGNKPDIVFLRSLFPQAVFLTLLRHPRDVLMSLLHVRWCPPSLGTDDGTSVRRFLRTYKRTAKAFIWARHRYPDHVRVLHYEELNDERAVCELFTPVGLEVGPEDHRRLKLAREARVGSSFAELARTVDPAVVATAHDQYERALVPFLTSLDTRTFEQLITWYPDLAGDSPGVRPG
jgi:hypothetical protein